MNIFRIVVECPEFSAEVPPTTPEGIVSLIEQSVSFVLLELFQEVIVHEVSIIPSLEEVTRRALPDGFDG